MDSNSIIVMLGTPPAYFTGSEPKLTLVLTLFKYFWGQISEFGILRKPYSTIIWLEEKCGDDFCLLASLVTQRSVRAGPGTQ